MINTRRMLLLVAVFIIFLPVLSFAGAIELSRTGQTTSYSEKDDGDIQMGVAWPSPRFMDNFDGTVTDNLTGLMWTQSGDVPGPAECTPSQTKNWTNALSYVDCLNTYNYLGHADWRLPNKAELISLFNAEIANQATWLNTMGFNSVQSSYYWSSTTYAPSTSSAWRVYMNSGDLGTGGKTSAYYVWAVRLGQQNNPSTAVANIPKTGQTSSYASGDDGALQWGVVWPSPRFTDNLDGTVTDNLTGLMWTQSANTPGPAGCIPAQTKNWTNALIYVDCLNSNNYLGRTDWRLPNKAELISLFNAEIANQATWLNTMGFNSVQSSYYWSSTTYAPSTSSAWRVYMNSGDLGTGGKTSAYYVWPVRGGSLFDVNVFPPSGKMVNTSGFDITLITPVPSGFSITGGSAVLDNNDVTSILLSCITKVGSLNPPLIGKTYRCPGMKGSTLGAGDHELTVEICYSNGTCDSDTVYWSVLGNTE